MDVAMSVPSGGLAPAVGGLGQVAPAGWVWFAVATVTKLAQKPLATLLSGSVVGQKNGIRLITAGGAVLMLISPGVPCVRFPYWGSSTVNRSEEHTSELQSHSFISYAVC